MLPEILNFNNEDVTEIYGSITYKIDFKHKRIVGKTNGLNSIKQSIFKILNTERFSKEIYSEHYGIEFEKFIGTNLDFIKSDIERTVSEALLIDDRIRKISNFNIVNLKKDSLEFSFIAETIEGNVSIEGGLDL